MAAINIMQTSGVPQAVSRFEAEDIKRSDEVLRTGLKVQLGLMVGLTAALFLLAPVAARLFHDARMTGYVRLTAFILPMYGLFSLYVGYYNGRHRFGRQAAMNIAYSIAKLVFVVALALAFSLKGAIVGFIIAPIVALAFGFHWPKTKQSFSTRRLIVYSLPLIGFAALSTLQLSVDLFSVKALVPVAAVAGYYAAAQNIALIPFFGLSAIGQVLFPNISRLLSSKDHAAAAEATTTSLRWTLLLLLPLVALIIGTAPALVHLLYGHRYGPAVPMLRVLVTGYIGLTIFALMANVLNGSGRARTAMVIAGGGVVVALIFCIKLIPHLGAVGAAVATGIGSVLVATSGLVMARRVVRYHVNWLSLARITLGSAVVLALGWWVRLPFLLLPLWWLVLGGVYLAWLTLTGEVKPSDWQLARGLLPARGRTT